MNEDNDVELIFGDENKKKFGELGQILLDKINRIYFLGKNNDEQPDSVELYARWELKDDKFINIVYAEIKFGDRIIYEEL